MSGQVVSVDQLVSPTPGCHVRCPFFFVYSHANSAFLHTFSADKSGESVVLLQNDKCSAKPHPIAFAVNSALFMIVSSDPGMTALSESLKQPDCHKFINAMKKELRDTIYHKHWKVVPLKSIPVEKHAITMVWSMKQKQNPLRDIVK